MGIPLLLLLSVVLVVGRLLHALTHHDLILAADHVRHHVLGVASRHRLLLGQALLSSVAVLGWIPSLSNTSRISTGYSQISHPMVSGAVVPSEHHHIVGIVLGASTQLIYRPDIPIHVRSRSSREGRVMDKIAALPSSAASRRVEHSTRDSLIL